MAVLLTPPYLQFFDPVTFLPLSGGLLYTYAAGTTTPKATYTDAGGLTPNANPVVLDSAGRASVWISGSYKFVLKDSLSNTVNTTDNITAFTAAGSLTPASIGTTQTSLASATTTDLGSIVSQNVLITGTTTITAFGSSAVIASPLYFIEFNGALTLTYNATSLIIPGSANITTAAGDTALVEYLGSGNWRVRNYMKANGTSITSLTPTRQYLTTGTGATYTTPAGCRSIYVRAWGGGGGGGATTANDGSAGGDTSFNSIVAKGGSGGAHGNTGAGSNAGGAGGVSGTGSASFRIAGNPGGFSAAGQSTLSMNGGMGGTTSIGGGGKGAATGGTVGGAAIANSGAGGGGSIGNGSGNSGGGGGGSGEYFELYISTPSATYTYTIGASGAGGSAGTNAGGAGGTGLIIIDEYYQ